MKTIITFGILGLSVLLFITSYSKSDSHKSLPSNTDGSPDTITINKQTWSTKNLDVSVFRNGEAIPEAKTESEWVNAALSKKPCWCYYNNDPSNAERYGKLYNWYAVNDSRGLAPEGWHIPTKEEWDELLTFLGGSAVAGTKLKSTEGWKNNANGTNESGMSGFPGGLRNGQGAWSFLGEFCFWWSSTVAIADNVWVIGFNYEEPSAWPYDTPKWNGYSVRCIKD